MIETVPLAKVLATYHTGIAIARLKTEPNERGATLSYIVKTAEIYEEGLELRGWSEEVWLSETKSKSLRLGAIVAPLKFTTHFSAVCVPSALNSIFAGRTLFSNSNTCVLYPIKAKYSSKYIALWLRSQDAWTQIKSLSRNTNSNGERLHRGFSTISLKKLMTIKIPVPALSEQELIINRYETQLAKWRRQQKEHKKIMNEIEEAFIEMRGDRVTIANI